MRITNIKPDYKHHLLVVMALFCVIFFIGAAYAENKPMSHPAKNACKADYEQYCQYAAGDKRAIARCMKKMNRNSQRNVGQRSSMHRHVFESYYKPVNMTCNNNAPMCSPATAEYFAAYNNMKIPSAHSAGVHCKMLVFTE